MRLRNCLQEHRQRASCHTRVGARREDEHPQHGIADALGLRADRIATVVMLLVHVMEAEIDLGGRRRRDPRWQDRAARGRDHNRQRLQEGPQLGPRRSLRAAEVQPRSARREGMERHLRAQQPSAPRHGLREAGAAQVRPADAVPEQLLAPGLGRRGRGAAAAGRRGEARSNSFARRSGQLGCGRASLLRPCRKKVEDRVFVRHQQLIGLQDLGQHRARQPPQRRPHLRVRQEGLELPHHELHGAITDLSQSSTVVSARDVEPAVLLQQ
mmetsp:Transcript_97691/g.280668  ORF Transcript_97691/g.280668 Transcript_97691/m.280668 type:complete len:269 (-) Transcript_97691:634-1440(-)